eukprot:CAMPEP_0114662142 /NCGR_PEP_ID=MMETSP0191-20121206/24175_1 /TAXON_ID=126664 /ORGANISM="Sorites sp." /LENGTH=123 /DNA_ID=CAMNT_0001897315 /DNA_START=67 /DNA_END=438 /DNA_ORIENTATION=-
MKKFVGWFNCDELFMFGFITVVLLSDVGIKVLIVGIVVGFAVLVVDWFDVVTLEILVWINVGGPVGNVGDTDGKDVGGNDGFEVDNLGVSVGSEVINVGAFVGVNDGKKVGISVGAIVSSVGV